MRSVELAGARIRVRARARARSATIEKVEMSRRRTREHAGVSIIGAAQVYNGQRGRTRVQVCTGSDRGRRAAGVCGGAGGCEGAGSGIL